ncbi:MAG: glycosyltransferase [Roseburia sp.]
MKILYYAWHENSENDLVESLLRMGYGVVRCHMPISDYEEDSRFTANLERVFIEQECDIFFSFDFFPLIAKSAEKLKRVYISWVYDAPHSTVFSPAAKSEFVKVFLFDRVQYHTVRERKPEGCFHMPLAVNAVRLEQQLGTLEAEQFYQHDISFVGGMYEKNKYRQIQYLPEYLRGYVEAMIRAQQKVYGYNFIEELLREGLEAELKKYVKMEMDESYEIPLASLYADMINAEVTARDRLELLLAATKVGKVTLYSGTKIEEVENLSQAGIVDYFKEMPRIFRTSKINLNISLRSITSGIPLRALDIMGAGGFLLSNYQPELAEYFIDGEEMVLFESEEDMLWKIKYYLEHEQERKRIAYNGWRKVQREFSYETQLKKIMELAKVE